MQHYIETCLSDPAKSTKLSLPLATACVCKFVVSMMKLMMRCEREDSRFMLVAETCLRFCPPVITSISCWAEVTSFMVAPWTITIPPASVLISNLTYNHKNIKKSRFLRRSYWFLLGRTEEVDDCVLVELQHVGFDWRGELNWVSFENSEQFINPSWSESWQRVISINRKRLSWPRLTISKNTHVESIHSRLNQMLCAFKHLIQRFSL